MWNCEELNELRMLGVEVGKRDDKSSHAISAEIGRLSNGIEIELNKLKHEVDLAELSVVDIIKVTGDEIDILKKKNDDLLELGDARETAVHIFFNENTRLNSEAETLRSENIRLQEYIEEMKMYMRDE